MHVSSRDVQSSPATKPPRPVARLVQKPSTMIFASTSRFAFAVSRAAATAIGVALLAGCGSSGSDDSSSGGYALSGTYTSRDPSAIYQKMVFSLSDHTYSAWAPGCSTDACVSSGTFSISGSTLTLEDAASGATVQLAMAKVQVAPPSSFTDPTSSVSATSTSSSLRPLTCIVCGTSDAELAKVQADIVRLKALHEELVASMNVDPLETLQLDADAQAAALAASAHAMALIERTDDSVDKGP